MKFNTKKTLVNILVSFCLLFFIGGNALAAADNEESGDSFLQTQVDNMDPIIKPYAQFVADNVVATFLFLGGVFLLHDGLQASRKKKQGKTTEAADYKNSTVETAKQLGLALVLFAVFVAAVKSDLINLV